MSRTKKDFILATVYRPSFKRELLKFALLICALLCTQISDLLEISDIN